MKTFRVWKTIKLGTHNDLKTLKKYIEEQGLQVGDWAANIMAKTTFTIAYKETAIDLVCVSVAELGFFNSTLLRDIYDQAIKLGLSLCPAEVGPQLRLQYPEQPSGEWLFIAMEPLTDSCGYPDIFGVVRTDGEQHIIAFGGAPDSTWGADRRFLFVLCR